MKNTGLTLSFDTGTKDRAVGLVCFRDRDGKITVLSTFDIPPEIAAQLPDNQMFTQVPTKSEPAPQPPSGWHGEPPEVL